MALSRAINLKLGELTETVAENILIEKSKGLGRMIQERTEATAAIDLGGHQPQLTATGLTNVVRWMRGEGISVNENSAVPTLVAAAALQAGLV